MAEESCHGSCHGSCLCGTLQWRIEKPIRMTHCHCSMCRKAHGAPFATILCVAPENLHFESGADNVVYFESSPGYRRAFCATCGSCAPVDFDGEMDIPAGCLDGDPGSRPIRHIFVASKAPWHAIGGGLPQLATYEDDGGGASVERPDPGPAKEGVLRGSCLCGGAAYEVSGEIGPIFNCHCTRCRKARAAAHTTNGFVAAAALRYVRGAELIRRYKVPEAKAFSQSFCSRCGSGMPHAGVSEGKAAIPLGSLDDDPGRGADCHIFVGSKAVWYEIEDGLPQFEERPPSKG
ncbi:MAG: GFA family protein [Rhodovibrionaceae bacterium]